MHSPRILIADDTPEKLESMYDTVREANPDAVIDTATSVPKAIALTKLFGKRYDKAVIDFDFPDDRACGDQIIRAIRKENRLAIVVCATAREGRPFEEAKESALEAGSNDAVCFLEADFRDRLTALI